MEDILRLFTESSLYDACLQMLEYLHVEVNEVTKEPVSFVDLYKGSYSATLPMALREASDKVEATYYLGNIDGATLAGDGIGKSVDEVRADTAAGKYDGMMVFAVDVAEGEALSRQESTTLTRGFNRIASAQPVVLFIRQGKYLSLATCERMEYSQEWRNGSSEKLGKVSILRNINCEHPHRGHLDILKALGDKAYPTFEALYKHWMEVFSNELLTKKFYSELSDWYAWAVQVARFPNDLRTNEDDEKFNHEACIRLITRLIFVWFLKQKHLIPDEFFDEEYIKEHFIENFDPHDRKSIFYDTEKSNYYRLILQNLFFAMLNRPIVAEGKDKAENRRFRPKVTGFYKNDGYNINNLMRYESDFMPGGADDFLRLANSSVPFLNGGLFECLDDKPNKIYFDGFSENPKSLAQLYLPDFLFFGDEVGSCIDLSQWYGDRKKKNVSAQGIIDILRHYCFTVEENTPYDQEVSLDPELLGKAFENLLAAYNPETQTSARKQTGSFYTPREIVQYMVNESLVAHLKRICGDKDETLYRQLLSYSAEEVSVTEEQSNSIMDALYHCRVLDPACGSGAFPMGILQQMVHVLKRIDPTNEKWKDFMINRAIEQSKKAFMVDSDTERKERLDDIESAFNRSVNDPDYARKLYLIEHCIYGVDIQPIATQISKLRFFISLVVDQRPTTDAVHNFGIRPLPNLEAKFVSANTLIPVEYDSSLVDGAPEVIKYKDELKELNHRIFLARRNIDKQNLKKQIKETRKALAEAIEDTGFVSHGAAQQLADWDMFDQNTSSPFFDPEWMFGVKGGFDIVIANPPYVLIPSSLYKDLYSKNFLWQEGKIDLYRLFIEKTLRCLLDKFGVMLFITPNTFLTIPSCKRLRKNVISSSDILFIDNYDTTVFESVSVNSIVFGLSKQKRKNNMIRVSLHEKDFFRSFRLAQEDISEKNNYSFLIFTNDDNNNLVNKINNAGFIPLNALEVSICLGEQPYHNTIHTQEQIQTKFLHSKKQLNQNYMKEYGGKNIVRYGIKERNDNWLDYSGELYTKPDIAFFKEPRVILREIIGKHLVATYTEETFLVNKSCYVVISKGENRVFLKYLLGILNSSLVGFYVQNLGDKSKQRLFPRITMGTLKKIPIPIEKSVFKRKIVFLVEQLLNGSEGNSTALENQIDFLVYHLYGLTYDEVLTVDPDTPITREQYESGEYNS